MFDGGLLFFRATREVPAGTPGSDAWQPFITGTITDVPVEDRHSQMLSDRALSAIMPALAIQLGRRRRITSDASASQEGLSERQNRQERST